MANWMKDPLNWLLAPITGGNLFSDTGGSGSSSDSAAPGSITPDPATAVDWQGIVDAANQMAEANLARYPRVTAASRDATKAYVGPADAYMKNRFYSDLSGVLPSWRSTLIGTQVKNINSVNTLSDSLIAGQIPSDLQGQINRDSASLGIEHGLYGQKQSYNTARDLGMTSYDLMQTGANMKAGQVTPMINSLTNTTKALMPPTTDPAAIYMNSVNDVTGIASVNPTATLQTSAQVATSNAQMVWDGQVSNANLAMDKYQTSVNQQIANQAAQYQLYGSLLGGGASLGSSMLLAGA